MNHTACADIWQPIAPFWPLKSLIAVNPLQGFEDLPIEEALVKGSASFQHTFLPKPMEAVNRETIKWLQAYFDQSQATIQMPLREEGLYSAWRQLALYDTHLHGNDPQKIAWLNALSPSAEVTVNECLTRLNIPKESVNEFLTLLLTTLPGWASYIKYLTQWSGQSTPLKEIDYLAIRAVMTTLLYPDAVELLTYHTKALKASQSKESPLVKIERSEKMYRFSLLKKLAAQKVEPPPTPAAQFAFCIDVRSEPFRRALEATGDYETFGFAGFFGVPAQFTNTTTGDSHPSCPVLLKPKHDVKACYSHKKGHEVLTGLKRLYQSVKYTFTTPFAVAESLGMASGAWIGVRTLSPSFAHKLKKRFAQKPLAMHSALDSIPFANQCTYAENALRLMGLTHNFAPYVIFCGHGSCTQNNAFASSLDCGACGGHEGSGNARVLAQILNQPKVREHLAKRGIAIPETTRFMGGKHNTTTDEVTLFNGGESKALTQIKRDLNSARYENCRVRQGKMDKSPLPASAKEHVARRSQDWAQTRPEWGLAKNAAFVIGPRSLTKKLDLDGRCFLHSYEPDQDSDGKSLETILTAPMVVAQWINTQYLFSTLDNIAYGGGSKITKNITGKIGVMQGNASDLMTGLPLQSVYASDQKPYHEPQRLMTVVYAPKERIDAIVKQQPVLQKLFGNGWVQLVCLEPKTQKVHILQRDFSWKVMFT